MRVLGVAGTEFISLHPVRALLRDGHEVAVLNRGRQRERLPGVRPVTCDRTDHPALRRAPAGERVDALVDVRLAQTREWYLREGLDRRPVDFSMEDARLREREAR